MWAITNSTAIAGNNNFISNPKYLIFEKGDAQEDCIYVEFIASKQMSAELNLPVSMLGMLLDITCVLSKDFGRLSRNLFGKLATKALCNRYL